MRGVDAVFEARMGVFDGQRKSWDGPSTFDRALLMSLTQASHSSGTEKVAS